MRNSFDETDRLHRVVFQSGRVILESDLNRMVSVLLHRFERSIEDLIGPHGGNGFTISIDENNDNKLSIAKGRYYVHGILCENGNSCVITAQPDYVFEPFGKGGMYLLYLDVFEAHAAGRPEVELQGIDTVVEAKVIWQVKALAVEKKPPSVAAGPTSLADIDLSKVELLEQDRWALFNIAKDAFPPDSQDLKPYEENVKAIQQPLMRARANSAAQASNPCTIPAESRFRGLDRQFYRVEVHRSGDAKAKKTTPTIKWSRENSSLIFPMIGPPSSNAGQTRVKVEHLGKDAKLGLSIGHWVELAYEEEHRHSIPGQLMQILEIDRDLLQITLRGELQSKNSGQEQTPGIMRRWDHQEGDEGGIAIREGWISIENGVQVQFEFNFEDEKSYFYHRGMYWAFVASPSLGDIEWEKKGDGEEMESKFLPPQGVLHHYAPLAFVEVGDDKTPNILKKLHKTISPPVGP